MDLTEFKNFTTELAVESGKHITKIWNEDDLGLEFKDDNTPVTRADREAEEIMRDMIRKRFPSHCIIAEEYGSENEDAEFAWILDPIDGTKSFMAHIPLFGTLIGLLHRGEPILGAIHQPILGQLAMGDNETTTLNGKPVKARVQNIERSILLATDPRLLEMTDDRPGLKELCKSVYLRRTWGDCYGYMMVASGRADIMIDPKLAPWDVLPVVPVVRGAGAMLTDWDGNQVNLSNVSTTIAAHPSLHGEVLRCMRKEA
ncbi:MAG: inositol monophosphatase family protein [Puniceicoccales bacterium]